MRISLAADRKGTSSGLEEVQHKQVWNAFGYQKRDRNCFICDGIHVPHTHNPYFGLEWFLNEAPKRLESARGTPHSDIPIDTKETQSFYMTIVSTLYEIYDQKIA